MWLDASKVDCLNLCPRKYFYRYELDLVKKSEEPYPEGNAVAFGTAIHAALASIYNGTADKLVHCTCTSPDSLKCAFCNNERLIPVGVHHFLTEYPADPEDERDPRTRANGLAILHKYLEHYSKEDARIIAVEQVFEIDFGLFKYRGRIDLISERDDGSVVPWDHKTTTRFSQTYESEFKLSLALSGYMYGTQEVTGKPVVFSLLNVIRVSKNVEFKRFFTTRSPEEYEEWKHHINEAYRRIERYRATGFWPKSAPFACSAYFKQCQFWGLCTAGRDTHDTLIETAYEKHPWNPLGEQHE